MNIYFNVRLYEQINGFFGLFFIFLYFKYLKIYFNQAIFLEIPIKKHKLCQTHHIISENAIMIKNLIVN